MTSWQQRHHFQASTLWQTEHDIHILHGLTCSAFDQIVDDRKHDHRIAALRLMNRNTALIGSSHRARFRMSTPGQNVNEKFISVGLFKQLLQIARRLQFGIKRPMDAAYQRREMRHKSKPNLLAGDTAQTLADFRQIAGARPPHTP